MTYTPRTDLLADRIILVTGAGDGIGRTAAITFARYGATIILLGRTSSKLELVYDEIMANGDPEPGIAPMDLASVTPQQVVELGEVIKSTYGRLDGILHNAAQLGSRIPVETWDLNDWMRIMQVNAHAPFLLTRLLLPLLRQSPDAALLFTSSSVGARPRAYWGAYAVSKAAQDAFARLLAEELENTSNIRTNIVNPGGTRTKMRAAAYPTEDPATVKPADALMPLYLYLMGPDCKENGQTFGPDWLE
ncbi:MAG: YciK family oxidoreductase [Pseudomonadota bacterium]